MCANVQQPLLISPNLSAMSEGTYHGVHSSSRIDEIGGIIVAFIVAWLLILPLTAIYALNHPHIDTHIVKSIAVLAAFAVVSSGTLLIVARTSRHELFVASAGYCAILLVFISGSSSLP